MEGQTYTLKLRPTGKHETPPHVRLRAALKRLLRQYGLTCLSVTEGTQYVLTADGRSGVVVSESIGSWRIELFDAVALVAAGLLEPTGELVDVAKQDSRVFNNRDAFGQALAERAQEFDGGNQTCT